MVFVLVEPMHGNIMHLHCLLLLLLSDASCGIRGGTRHVAILRQRRNYYYTRIFFHTICHTASCDNDPTTIIDS